MAMKTDYVKQAQIRASAMLTNLYVAATILTDAYKYNQLVLFISFTKATTTSLEWKVEFSHDNSNWYQEPAEDWSALGVATVREIYHQIVSANQSSATQGYKFQIPITDRYIRVSVKATGVLTDSLCAIDAAFAVS